MLKVTFPLSYFCMTKSTKSHQRERSSLFDISSRVHEFVERAMRGKCVRQRIKRKSVVLPLSVASAIPRVRTYHTKEPSRFVHALSARPHKRVGGREYNMCADESKDFRQPSPAGEGVSHRLTDEVPFKKRLKVLFLFSYFCMTKSTKSHLRGLLPPVSATPTNALRALVHSPLLKITFRVHELVARAVRGECVRNRIKQKSAVLPLSMASSIPRVRT